MSGPKKIIKYLRYSTRSQLFAKSVPMPLVIGNQKRLDMLKNSPQKDKLWEVVNALQNGLRERGFDIGTTEAPVTPVYMHGSMTEVGNLIMDLRERYNIFCSIVTFPMIPRGQVLLRLIPTAAHTMRDVEETINAFEAIKDKLANGEYQKDGIAELMPEQQV